MSKQSVPNNTQLSFEFQGLGNRRGEVYSEELCAMCLILVSAPVHGFQSFRTVGRAHVPEPDPFVRRMQEPGETIRPY